jgi:hypothetical protein
MAKSIWLSLAGLLGWFALKGIGLGFWSWQLSISIGVLCHFSVMTALSVLSAHQGLEKNIQSFLERCKNGVKNTARHTLLITCGMAMWYYGIAPGALEKQKLSQIETVRKTLGTSTSYTELQAQHPELMGRTRDDVMKIQMNNIKVFYSPVFFIGLSLLLWLMAGIIIVVLMDVIWQRIWSS